MQTLRSVCLWLSSGLIAVVVSCVAALGVWMVFKMLQLDRRLGVDEGICLLALVVGPVMIRAIHRAIAGSWSIPIGSLALGLALGWFGGWQILRASEASARHVPAGLFSGLEHLFNMAIGLLVALVGTLALAGGILALVGRGIRIDADPGRATTDGGSVTGGGSPPRP